MKLGEFFKPTLLKLIIFIIFMIISYFILSVTNPEIFPCKTQPVIVNPPEFKLTTCSFDRIAPFSEIVGVTIKPLWNTYLLELIFLILIPYLIACLILINRKH